MTALALHSARDEIRAIGHTWSNSQYRLVHAAVALDDSGEWVADGAATCAHWIANSLDIEVCTAREWLRIGRDLSALPAIDAAFAAGTVSYSKVRALTRLAEPQNETELLDIAVRVPAGRLATALAAWLNRNEGAEQTEQRQHASRSLKWRAEPDGMTTLTLRLAPLAAAAVMAAVDTTLLKSQHLARQDRERTGQWPSLAQQRHDALLHRVTNGGTGTLTEVIVHVRGDGCTMNDGTPIADHAVARLLDQSFVRLLIHEANRRPINASGRHRSPTNRQKRVVHERHGGACVDCGGTDLIEYDHNPTWESTHRTVVDELEPRCAPCHHRRHAASGDG